MNVDDLFFYNQYVYLYLHINYEEFKKKLREKYSKKINLNQDNEFLKNFDLKKNQSAIPKNACLIEFLKTSKDSLLVAFLHNEGEVKVINIRVDDKFFKQCELYHELNSYETIREMNRDGKYLGQVEGEYVIEEGRENIPSDNAVAIKAADDKDNSKWLALRKNIAITLSEKIIPGLEKFAEKARHWIISPDAELNLVPFETLMYREKMLVETVDVSYVPSLVIMNLMKDAGEKNISMINRQELFAMGNAVYHNANSKVSHESQIKLFNKFRGNSNEQIDIKSLKWTELESAALELDKVSALFDNKTILIVMI